MNLKECSWILNFFTNSENSVILLFEWHEQFIHYYIVSDMSCSKCYEYLVCALDWQMFTLEAIEFSYENISSWILDRVYAFIHLLDDVLDCFAERSELILLNSPSLRDLKRKHMLEHLAACSSCQHRSALLHFEWLIHLQWLFGYEKSICLKVHPHLMLPTAT